MTSPLPPVARKAFTTAERLQILERQARPDGVVQCACGCGEVLASVKGGRVFPMRKMEFDHVTPLAQGGAHAVDNAEALLVRCHKRKSGPEWAATARAKRRTGVEGGQYARRKWQGPKLQSRGFRRD